MKLPLAPASLLTAALAVAAAAQPLAAPASEKDLPAYRPPAADEAHGLTGGERDAALLVQRSHYQNFLEAFGSLQLTGLDPKDLSKTATCTVSIAIDPGEFRKDTFVDGLPVRRAQPVVFNSFQRQMVEGVGACEAKIVFTTRTWADLQAQTLALILKNSGTTYCRTDADCYGVEIGADSCGNRPAVRAFGSITTDAVFFVALFKFLPPLMSNVQQLVTGTIMSHGDKHPDHGVRMDRNRCPMKHWEEKRVESACVQHACRALK